GGCAAGEWGHAGGRRGRWQGAVEGGGLAGPGLGPGLAPDPAPARAGWRTRARGARAAGERAEVAPKGWGRALPRAAAGGSSRCPTCWAATATATATAIAAAAAAVGGE